MLITHAKRKHRPYLRIINQVINLFLSSVKQFWIGAMPTLSAVRWQTLKKTTK
jgi:hypothetical protein